MTAIGVYVLSKRWAYTIRAIGNFPRQSFSLMLALVAALALWDASCILAGGERAGYPADMDPALVRLGLGASAAGPARALFALVTVRWSRQGRLARRTVVIAAAARRRWKPFAASNRRAAAH